MQRVQYITHLALFLFLMGIAGCDSLGEAAAQGTEASLRTLIDLLLTDFTNQVADSLLPPGQDEDEDGATSGSRAFGPRDWRTSELPNGVRKGK